MIYKDILTTEELDALLIDSEEAEDCEFDDQDLENLNKDADTCHKIDIE